MEGKAHVKGSKNVAGEVNANLNCNVSCNGLPSPKWLIKKIDKL
jgi:hypothetical protein